RARMFAIASGHEDCDDLDVLRSDPALKMACGRLPISGSDLMSQPTLSRLENTCVYRKLRFGRIDDAVRRPWHATRCVRSAEPGGRLAHPCPMSGAFSRCCNSSHTILTLGANVARPMRRHDRCTRGGSIRLASRQNSSAMASLGQWACRGYPWLVIGA